MFFALALVALAFCAWPAAAARLTDVAVTQSGGATRLVLRADGPLRFQLDLTGPESIEIALAETIMAAELPAAPRGLIADIRLDRRGDDLVLAVRFKQPGVTVLPIYDAPARRLTIELGGRPGQEERLAPPPEPTPTAEPAPESAPTPAPVTEPAPAQVAPAAAAAPLVRAVRVVAHDGFTRVALLADGPIEASFQAEGQVGWLRLKRGGLAPDARWDRPDKRVLGLGVIGRQPLVLRLQLARPAVRHRLFAAEDGRSAVLDLDLDGPPPAASTRQPMPAPPAEAEPTPEPTATPTASPPPPAPEAAAPEASPAPPAPQGPKTALAGPVTPAPTPGFSARMELRAQHLARNMPALAAVATIDRREPYLARGPMPPMPTPPTLARPRQAATAQPGPTPGPPQDAAQVLAAIKNAQQTAPAQPPTPISQPTPDSLATPAPPTAAQEADRQRQIADALLGRGRAALEDRDYNQALLAFQELMDRFPKDQAVPEAMFRFADAFYYENESKMAAKFHDVMFNYQRAIDLHPQSDQVPWALLMMGKASMAFGEPFRGMGYFEIVINDYPKSPYVPLALVNRGGAFQEQGKFAMAVAEYERVLASYPQSDYRVDAQWGLAKANFGMARFRAASDVLLEMSKENPQMHLQNPELLYYLGEAEFQLRDYNKARFYFLWALNIRPDMRDGDIILTRVGDSYGYQGQDRAAREIYAQVIDMYPDTDGALVARIRLAESPEKDVEHPWDIFQVKADLDAYRTYKEIADKYADRQVGQLAKVKLAVYHYKKNEFVKAIDTLEKFLQLNPNTPFRPEVDYTMNLAAIGLLESLRAENKPMELMDAYLRNRVLLTRPNSNQMLSLLAWAYESTGLYDRAAGLYKVLASRGMVDSKIWLAWAENLAKSGQTKEAVGVLEDIDTANLKGPEITRVRSLLGRMLCLDGQYEKAAKALQELIKGSPNHGGAEADYRALGQSLAALNRPAEALPAFEKAIALLTPMQGPEVDLERYLLAMEAGAAAVASGKLDLGVTHFATAESLAQSPADKAQAMYELSRAYGRLGQNKRMTEVLDDLAKMGLTPWSEMAQGALNDQKLSKRLLQMGK